MPREFAIVIESDRGLHILRRIPVEEFAALHIWIQYKGAEGASPKCTRTKEEALAFAPGGAQREREDHGDEQDADRVVPVEQLEAVSFGGLEGVGVRGNSGRPATTTFPE